MYYARGRAHPNVVRRRRRTEEEEEKEAEKNDEEEEEEEEGTRDGRTKEKDTAKDEGGVCV